jgi:hypothetical protein
VPNDPPEGPPRLIGTTLHHHRVASRLGEEPSLVARRVVGEEVHELEVPTNASVDAVAPLEDPVVLHGRAQ